jgi:DNA polymerase-4
MVNQENEHIPELGLNWLFLDLNSYFASVEQNENPSLRGKPVAVVPMMADSTCAIAASYEAKALDIKTGTRIYEAKKKCPDLHCVLARHDIYTDYHHRIFTELENYLHVTKICSVDEAACELLGSEREPENAIALANTIKIGLHKNIGPSINCSIGIAPNSFLAKTASNLEKPNGLVLLTKNNLKEQLFSLKLTDLTGINTGIENRLNKGDIHTIEQFWNISPKHARKVWGSVEGERFWYKLHGYNIPDVETTKSVVGHSRVLDPALRHPDKAYDIARQLTVKAAARLRRYDLYAKKFSLIVRSVEGFKWADTHAFSPAQDNFTFIKALNDMWHHMQCKLQKPQLFKVSVTIHELYNREDVTLDLFGVNEPKQEKDLALSKSIDDINSRYGSNTLNVGYYPKTQAGHVGTKIAFTRIPEKAEFNE